MQHALDTYSEEKCRQVAAGFVAHETWQVPTLIRLRTTEMCDAPETIGPGLERVQPNPGHLALARLESCLSDPEQFALFTQNVDDLHQRAGSRNVIELHGNIARIKCSREDRVVASWLPTRQVPPPCPHCGAPLRPDVVWFGEILPAENLEAAMRAARDCDLLFSIGTLPLPGRGQRDHQHHFLQPLGAGGHVHKELAGFRGRGASQPHRRE